MEDLCKKSFENKLCEIPHKQKTIISALIKEILIKPLLSPAAK